MKIILILLIPFICFTQIPNKFNQEVKFISSNCDENSKKIAHSTLIELKLIQKENMFDTTLKNYYEILENTKCKYYDDLLIDMWTNEKIISETFFDRNINNNDELYQKFIEGFKLKKDFRFAEPKESIDQGINEDLQAIMLNYVFKKSSNDFDEIVKLNIQTLESHDLLSFINTIESKFKLEKYNNILIEKVKTSKKPFDIYILINKLIKHNTDKLELEKILNETNKIWDNGGNWSQKFWDLIAENNLRLNNYRYYSTYEYDKHPYDKIINEYILDDKITKSPLLIVNGDIVKFQENKLIELIMSLNISSIQIITKENSVSLFGKNGLNGAFLINTK